MLTLIALLASLGPAASVGRPAAAAADGDRHEVAMCYRRMDIELADCPENPQFDTWTLTRTSTKAQWTKHPHTNCFGGSGAKTVPGPEPWPTDNGNTKVTLDQCMQACTSDHQCSGIVTGLFGPSPPPPPPGGIAWNPGEQIPGPASASVTAAWFTSMQEWRAAARNTSSDGFTGKAFEDPLLKWTQTSYIQPQMHPYDRFFFDPTIGDMGDYTVQKWLEDVNQRYGGVDAILMWPTYTNIGVDDRSQFDLFEAMPGGVAGVRKVVDQLHAAGIRVLIPYNPWDGGTLRCGPGLATCGGNANLTAETAKNPGYCDGPATAAVPGVCDARIMDSLIKEMDADGFNGDTMGFVPYEFYQVSVGLNHSVAIEPEGGGNVVNSDAADADGGIAANWDTMGWGYWGYPYVPSVDSWKWLDSRRMTNICERWSKNHTNALQYALFNGDGFESWENVWGTWNGITERDGEQVRRVGALLRFLGGRGYLLSQGWVPHSPTSEPENIFASFWPSESGDGSAAWTVVNRDLTLHSGPTLEQVKAPAGTRFFDLYNGLEVKPVDGVLSLEVERFGAVLATSKGPESDPELKDLMAKMAGYAKVKIADLDPTWHYEYGARVPVARAETPSSISGMANISGGPFRFFVKGIEIEGAGGTGDPRSPSVNPFGVDFQYEWEAQPNRYHNQWLNLPEFYLDITPVTQGAFAEYLVKNPSALSKDRYHYLKNWDWSNPDAPKPHAGKATLPVTYVGMDEARAYCKSVGKRLPREEEWQFAATGGGEGTRVYPWGDSPPGPDMVPTQVTGTVFPGPEHVGKHPAGASPFGIQDMIGNVWQMTDEYQDTHTRSVILRGGCNYRPSSSMWYFPMVDGNCVSGHCGWTTNQIHNKYFLMNSRYERAGTVGFRCAADVPGSDNLDCGGKSLCGRFQAPDASVTLASADEWVVFAGNSTVRSSTGTNISAAASLQPLTACNGTQSTFTWDDGEKSTSAASCIANGTDSIAFNVAATPGTAPTTLSVYGGATGAGLMVTATLHDGAEVTTFSDRINVTANEIHQQVTYNVRWELRFVAKTTGATLRVEISAPSAPIPPPPPPAPPPASLPCRGLMCGSVTKHTGDVDLSSTGSSDWIHYGLGGAADTVNRKCAAGSLIQPLVMDGSAVPFGDCPQTFSWSDGGSPPGTPADAQFGIEQQTPTAIFLGPDGGTVGGFTFTVDVPAVTSTTNVYLYFGACGNLGVLNATLENLDNGEETGFSYTMTAADAENCQETYTAQLTIPASSSPAKRKLSGFWGRLADGHVARNIQFHAIAVDAGGPVANGGGAETPCTHKNPSSNPGAVALQAAVLA